MKLKTLAQLLAISGTVSCVAAAPGLADAEHCRHVGDGILTNFLQKADCGSSPSGLCTDGPAAVISEGRSEWPSSRSPGMSCTTIIIG